MLTMLARAAAWSAFAATIVLSVVPVGLRPHVMADKHYEHFTAYLIAAALFAMAYPRLREATSGALMLTICAGVLEIAQLWIAGRTSSLADFLFSTLGAWIGVAATIALLGAYGRMHAFAPLRDRRDKR